MATVYVSLTSGISFGSGIIGIMLGPNCTVCSQPQPSFWAYQLKDLVTGLVALAALVTSLTGVWVAYLRPRRLRCDLGNIVRISYGGRSKRRVRFMVDTYAINAGARPGVITRMAIRLWCAGSEDSATTLYWRETTKSEDIAEKGSSRRVWTIFAGFASAVLVPKYDSRLIEAAFFSEDDFDLEEGGNYSFQLNCWVDGSRKPILGRVKQFTITQSSFRFLQAKATADDSGIVQRHLFLTSDDGETFIAPSSANWMPDRTTPGREPSSRE